MDLQVGDLVKVWGFSRCGNLFEGNSLMITEIVFDRCNNLVKFGNYIVHRKQCEFVSRPKQKDEKEIIKEQLTSLLQNVIQKFGPLPNELMKDILLFLVPSILVMLIFILGLLVIRFIFTL